jgi:four helix bundle protein
MGEWANGRSDDGVTGSHMVAIMIKSQLQPAIRSHRDLQVWQLAMQLVVEVYRLSSRFPHEERFGLISQIRRAAVSVPTNIAEGRARFGHREFRQFASIARGSVAEVETLLEIATRLEFAAPSEFEKATGLCLQVARMLTRLHQRLSKLK